MPKCQNLHRVVKRCLGILQIQGLRSLAVLPNQGDFDCPTNLVPPADFQWDEEDECRRLVFVLEFRQGRQQRQNGVHKLPINHPPLNLELMAV